MIFIISLIVQKSTKNEFNWTYLGKISIFDDFFLDQKFPTGGK